MNPAISHNQNIRWLILVIIYAQRANGATESGGWLREDLLRRLLAAEGYPLSVEELRIYCDYLEDQTIACLEKKRLGDPIHPDCKYRLTAKGMRAATREERVIGIGVSGNE